MWSVRATIGAIDLTVDSDRGVIDLTSVGVSRRTEHVMSSSMVKTVLEMGYRREAIKTTMLRRIRTTGSNFPNAAALVEALLKDDDNSDVSITAVTYPAPQSDIDENKLCKICATVETNTAFVPCGHLACCGPCAVKFSACPVCRARIKNTVRIYPA